MLTANVGFLAIPGVVISNASGGNITSASQVIIFTSPTQVASCLSAQASIGSIVTGLLLVRPNLTKRNEDPLGMVSRTVTTDICSEVIFGQLSYLPENSHKFFGLEPIAILYCLPWALLMWSYVFSCLSRRRTLLNAMESLPLVQDGDVFHCSIAFLFHYFKPNDTYL